MDDVQLVSETYEQCWQRSRGRYNSWIEGRLHPLARRFYIVVNATERWLMSGVTSVLDDVRFTLAETAAAYDSFGLPRHAEVMRGLAALVDDSGLSRDHRERWRQLLEIQIPSGEVDRLGEQFPTTEDEVWGALAKVIREHPEAFAASGDAGG